MKARLFRTAIAAGCISGCLVEVFGDAVLILRDPGEPLTDAIQIYDNGPGDASRIRGLISFSGSVGPNWIGTVTVGASKPVNGTIPWPATTLESVDFSSPGSAKLWIGFSDNFFGPLPAGGAFAAELHGNTAGSVRMDTYADPGNLLPDKSTFNEGTTGPGYIIRLGVGRVVLDQDTHSATDFAVIPRDVWPSGLAYPYSTTMGFEIAHDGHQLVEETTFNATLFRVGVPDTGSTAMLLALSVGTLGIAARRSVGSVGSGFTRRSGC